MGKGSSRRQPQVGRSKFFRRWDKSHRHPGPDDRCRVCSKPGKAIYHPGKCPKPQPMQVTRIPAIPKEQRELHRGLIVRALLEKARAKKEKEREAAKRPIPWPIPLLPEDVEGLGEQEHDALTLLQDLGDAGVKDKPPEGGGSIRG